jgi:hypothetical protein
MEAIMAEQYLAATAVFLTVVFLTVLVILFRSRRELSRVRRMVARDRKHVAMNDAAIKALFLRVSELERIKSSGIHVVEGPRALRR